MGEREGVVRCGRGSRMSAMVNGCGCRGRRRTDTDRDTGTGTCKDTNTATDTQPQTQMRTHAQICHSVSRGSCRCGQRPGEEGVTSQWVAQPQSATRCLIPNPPSPPPSPFPTSLSHLPVLVLPAAGLGAGDSGSRCPRRHHCCCCCPSLRLIGRYCWCLLTCTGRIFRR